MGIIIKRQLLNLDWISQNKKKLAIGNPFLRLTTSLLLATPWKIIKYNFTIYSSSTTNLNLFFPTTLPSPTLLHLPTLSLICLPLLLPAPPPPTPPSPALLHLHLHPLPSSSPTPSFGATRRCPMPLHHPTSFATCRSKRREKREEKAHLRSFTDGYLWNIKKNKMRLQITNNRLVTKIF